MHEAVNKLAVTGQTIVFLFDHFDECQNRLPRSFFQMLKSLKSLAKYKFSVVFATRRDLVHLVDEEIVRDYWDFFVGNTIYLKIYEKNAEEFMFLQIEKVFGKKLTSEQRSKIAKICGGHAKLTKIISELILGQNIELEISAIVKNRQIQAALYEIWLFLTSSEQRSLLLISQNQKNNNQNLTEMYPVDESLINFDLIRQKLPSGNLEFTIPIFEEFIKTMGPNLHEKITYNSQTSEIQKGANIISELLSPQEHRLLKFLILNQGKIVGRDELISEVWPQNQVAEAISDEAIDQMVFRLRKKIEETPANPKHLLTVKGRGLKFEP